ncbi:CAMK family protein kinase [Histomonas meleagridis]|nr:CAMK family protein kinase [Histomonas meleagridis]
MANTVIGTPYYLSPEIWEGKPYDSHSDIYSLGVILYELCALKKPYEAPNALALCSIVTKGEHEDIPNIYSDDLKNLVNRMLSLDPHQRPTAREIKQMKIITKGAINIINKNQTIISKQINSPKRKRLLNLNLMNNTNANEQENIPFNDFIDEDDENEEEEMVIEDDFIEDDFIKEEEEEEEEMDEEQLFLLQETSNALRQSIIISPMK